MKHSSQDQAEAAPGQTEEPGTPAVEMRGIWKRYGGVVANAGVDFTLERGEIHALLGENGAGKTTLMNILYGLVRPDAGEIRLERQLLELRSPEDAIRAGIGMVHQHFMLVPTLTVAENMLVGERITGLLRRRDVEAVAERLAYLGKRYGLHVPVERFVWQLSVGEQQRVEILRALYRNARVLILDEPTASLAPMETDALLRKIRTMADDGASVVIITHHLDEVMTFADRITVLRGGKRVASLLASETDADELARLMVGEDVSLRRVVKGDTAQQTEEPGVQRSGDRPVLEIKQLSVNSDQEQLALREVSFDVAAGEIVAIAGVEGNGQAELEEALVGLRSPAGGQILLHGTDITGHGPAERLRRGLGYVPSDRYRRGLVRGLTVAENLVLDRVDQPPIGGLFLIRLRAMLAHATELIRQFRIKVAGPRMPARTLSGGNAQRVVLARALTGELQFLVSAQPTRGLDVSAVEFVWAQLQAQREAGTAVLLLSMDLDEILTLADRCYVIYRGQLVGHWSREEYNRELIGRAMGGL